MSATESGPLVWAQHHRVLIAAITLAVLWVIESLAPMFVGRKRRFSHIATNLALAGINALVASGFAFAILGVTEWARAHSFGLLNLRPLPAWLHWAGAIVLFDCWQYWWHRFNHRVPFLWRFHSVHHADAELDASSGVRFHTGEMILSFLVRLAVLPLIGLTVPQLLLYEVISLPVILFHHSNVRMPGWADRCLRWLIVTPWMHYVHHSRWQPETDSNYTSLLSVWDRLFGSFRLRDKPAEISLGLDNYEEREWRRLPGMLAAPFKKTPVRDVSTQTPAATESSSSSSSSS
jgi:sterol desaturase/sphingolipid hydroxylase (fatty acid hydroxylase superfamily)